VESLRNFGALWFDYDSITQNAGMARLVKCLGTTGLGLIQDSGFEFSLPQHVQTCSGAHITLCLMDKNVSCFLFMRLKLSEYGACSPDQCQNGAMK
jgi:hypothetical protein